MTTFAELDFKSHPIGSGIQAQVKFENGYGASVIRTNFSYGSENDLYELAVIRLDGSLVYDTPVTDDVEGYLSEDCITALLDQIEALPIIS